MSNQSLHRRWIACRRSSLTRTQISLRHQEASCGMNSSCTRYRLVIVGTILMVLPASLLQGEGTLGKSPYLRLVDFLNFGQPLCAEFACKRQTISQTKHCFYNLNTSTVFCFSGDHCFSAVDFLLSHFFESSFGFCASHRKDSPEQDKATSIAAAGGGRPCLQNLALLKNVSSSEA